MKKYNLTVYTNFEDVKKVMDFRNGGVAEKQFDDYGFITIFKRDGNKTWCSCGKGLDRSKESTDCEECFRTTQREKKLNRILNEI